MLRAGKAFDRMKAKGDNFKTQIIDKEVKDLQGRKKSRKLDHEQTLMNYCRNKPEPRDKPYRDSISVWFLKT